MCLIYGYGLLRWFLLTSSFPCTHSDILFKPSWFEWSTLPKFLIRSPTRRPADSAGLLSMMLLTLAKGGVSFDGPDEELFGITALEADIEVEFEFFPFKSIASMFNPLLLARLAKCACNRFSITTINSFRSPKRKLIRARVDRTNWDMG